MNGVNGRVVVVELGLEIGRHLTGHNTAKKALHKLNHQPPTTLHHLAGEVFHFDDDAFIRPSHRYHAQFDQKVSDLKARSFRLDFQFLGVDLVEFEQQQVK